LLVTSIMIPHQEHILHRDWPGIRVRDGQCHRIVARQGDP
jgi:hypothetical protein